EIRGNSAAPDRDLFSAAPDTQSGRMFGNLHLTESAYLRVHERIVVKDGAFVVEKYVYNLVRDERTIWAYDKDPTHEPVVHGHIGSDRRRVPAGELTLEEALELAWRELEDWRSD